MDDLAPYEPSDEDIMTVLRAAEAGAFKCPAGMAVWSTTWGAQASRQLIEWMGQRDLLSLGKFTLTRKDRTKVVFEHAYLGDSGRVRLMKEAKKATKRKRA